MRKITPVYIQLCSVVVQQEHAYIQHCKGKKHVSKTNIGAETSAGATGPKNTTVYLFCLNYLQTLCARIASNSWQIYQKFYRAMGFSFKTMSLSSLQEVFHCAMCNVTCATGKETLEHLSSKEHAMGPGLKKVEENAKKEEEQHGETDKKEEAGKMETELDPSEIINKFYCDVCEYVSHLDSSDAEVFLFCGSN